MLLKISGEQFCSNNDVPHSIHHYYIRIKLSANYKDDPNTYITSGTHLHKVLVDFQTHTCKDNGIHVKHMFQGTRSNDNAWHMLNIINIYYILRL